MALELSRCGGNWKSSRDFEESVSEILSCLEYTVHVILDFEETVWEDLKKLRKDQIQDPS